VSASPLAPPAARSSAAQPYDASKRALDAAAALLLLVVLAPILLVCALAAWAGSSRRPLFRQPRAGRFGETFGMWKFRTMVLDAEQVRSALMIQSHDPDWLALDKDPRVTRAGRILRRTSLDELPQLINVLRGEMSLVGPRPLPLEEHVRLPAWSARRLDVRPGVTGLWQVSGRARVSFQDMLRLDCLYVRERSLWNDLKILARTPFAVLLGRGCN
jgi:lipopolysaccharide/colanic/teichoic acid biosynthesis glycosyltransferase